MKENKPVKIVYAGDRDISVRVLKFILEQDIKPLALLVPDKEKANHSQELISLCDYLSDSYVLKSNQFRTKQGMALLRELQIDYIISVHFPYLFPKQCLEIAKEGVLNLHSAYLPYNRGWHTSTWAVEENTPFGATFHFMDEGVDTGDIILQKRITILPHETADAFING